MDGATITRATDSQHRKTGIDGVSFGSDGNTDTTSLFAVDFGMSVGCLASQYPVPPAKVITKI